MGQVGCLLSLSWLFIQLQKSLGLDYRLCFYRTILAQFKLNHEQNTVQQQPSHSQFQRIQNYAKNKFLLIIQNRLPCWIFMLIALPAKSLKIYVQCFKCTAFI